MHRLYGALALDLLVSNLSCETPPPRRRPPPPDRQEPVGAGARSAEGQHVLPQPPQEHVRGGRI